MKEAGLVFLMLCFMVVFVGCTVNSGKNMSSESMAQAASITDTAEDTDGNFRTRNCMIDDIGNLLVMHKCGHEPYAYDRFPDIPRNLSRIIRMLRESNNVVSLDYDDKLYLSYGLGEGKSWIAGGNDVDVFNFSIDREEDVVEFSVEQLIFDGEIEGDYRPLLLETFKLLFGERGEDIFRYLMGFYEQPVDGATDETRINGMTVKYKCTPKHRLVVSLVAGE